MFVVGKKRHFTLTRRGDIDTGIILHNYPPTFFAKIENRRNLIVVCEVLF